MMKNGNPKPNKYAREIKPGVFVDVYDVLRAFRVNCPARGHAIKKLLAAGERGHKDELTDLMESGASIDRAIQLKHCEDQITTRIVSEKPEGGGV